MHSLQYDDRRFFYYSQNVIIVHLSVSDCAYNKLNDFLSHKSQ